MRSPVTPSLGQSTPEWRKGVGSLSFAADFEHRLAVYEVGWVCEVLRMTRLAPDIFRAILEGRQPRHLNLHAMRGRQGEVPLDWEEQRGMFGFAAARG